MSIGNVPEALLGLNNDRGDLLYVEGVELKRWEPTGTIGSKIHRFVLGIQGKFDKVDVAKKIKNSLSGVSGDEEIASKLNILSRRFFWSEGFSGNHEASKIIRNEAQRIRQNPLQVEFDNWILRASPPSGIIKHIQGKIIRGEIKYCNESGEKTNLIVRFNVEWNVFRNKCRKLELPKKTIPSAIAPSKVVQNSLQKEFDTWVKRVQPEPFISFYMQKNIIAYQGSNVQKNFDVIKQNLEKSPAIKARAEADFKAHEEEVAASARLKQVEKFRTEFKEKTSSLVSRAKKYGSESTQAQLEDLTEKQISRLLRGEDSIDDVVARVKKSVNRDCIVNQFDEGVNRFNRECGGDLDLSWVEKDRIEYIRLTDNIPIDSDMRPYMETLGCRTNQSLLGALFKKYHPEIGKKLGASNTLENCCEVFKDALMGVAKTQGLNPNQVFRGEVRLTGCSKKVMEGFLQDAIKRRAGNPEAAS